MVIESGQSYAVILGDVVKSREVEPQERLLADLRDAHRWLADRVEAVEPVTVTVGDEFQGIYRHVRSALLAATLLRLHLKGRYDVRFGIGWGAVETVAPERAPLAQSGAGWWNAREAIDEASKLVTKNGWPRSIRTRIRGLEPDLERVTLAYLLCQDHLIDAMDEKDAQIAVGLFEGERQAEVGDRLAIAQSSVSRRQRENGPVTLYRAHLELAELLS